MNCLILPLVLNITEIFQKFSIILTRIGKLTTESISMHFKGGRLAPKVALIDSFFSNFLCLGNGHLFAWHCTAADVSGPLQGIDLPLSLCFNHRHLNYFTKKIKQTYRHLNRVTGISGSFVRIFRFRFLASVRRCRTRRTLLFLLSLSSPVRFSSF